MSLTTRESSSCYKEQNSISVSKVPDSKPQRWYKRMTPTRCGSTVFISSSGREWIVWNFIWRDTVKRNLSRFDIKNRSVHRVITMMIFNILEGIGIDTLQCRTSFNYYRTRNKNINNGTTKHICTRCRNIET